MTEIQRITRALQKWLDVSMHQSMQSFFRYAKQNNISVSQVGALFHINARGMCGVTDISERLSVTSAAASQMIDRLVQLDLLERTEDPNDRRVRRLSLTDQGRIILDESMLARQSWIEEIVNSLNEEEQALVFAALETLLAKSAQLDASAADRNPA